MRAVIAITCTASLMCFPLAQSKISAQRVEDLIRSSDEIIVATIAEVSEPSALNGGVRIATAKIVSVLKGEHLRTLQFRASPGWMCDITDAKTGDAVLLFLSGSFNGAFGVALAGRGYMPLRRVDGKQYATLWDDVVLPEGAPVIPGPDRRFTFIRSVELRYLEDLVVKDGSAKPLSNNRWRGP
jgi:hypothetical protein